MSLGMTSLARKRYMSQNSLHPAKANTQTYSMMYLKRTAPSLQWHYKNYRFTTPSIKICLLKRALFSIWRDGEHINEHSQCVGMLFQSPMTPNRIIYGTVSVMHTLQNWLAKPCPYQLTPWFTRESIRPQLPDGPS